MSITKYILSESSASIKNLQSYYKTLTDLHVDIEIEIEKLLKQKWGGHFSMIPHTAHESMYIDLYQDRDDEEALYNIRFSTHPRKYPPRNGGKPIDIDTNRFIKVDYDGYPEEDVDRYPEDFYDEYMWYYDLRGEVIPFINELINTINNVAITPNK